jgi:hypothetical protein
MPSMKRLVCTIVLLLLIVGGIARIGGRYWRAYDTIKGQVEAEQDYVERVEREAGQ